MAVDGNIQLVVDLSTKDAKQSLKELRRTITSSFSDVATNNLDKGLVAVNKTLKETQREFTKVQNEITNTEDKLRELQTKQSVILGRGIRSATKTTQYEYGGKFFSKSDFAAIQLLDTQLANADARLVNLHGNADILTTQLNSAGNAGAKMANKATSGLDNVNKSVKKLGIRIIGLAKRVFIFSMITKALRSLRTMLTSIAKSDMQFANSLKQIKSNLWTAFGAIYTKALPPLNLLMSALAKATSYITAFLVALTGSTVSSAYKKANELYQQVNKDTLLKQQQGQIDSEIKAIQDKIKALEKENNAIEKNEKVQEAANKKSTLDFDELKQLSTPEQENEQITANNEIIEQLNEQIEKLQEQKDILDSEIDSANNLADTLTYPTATDTIFDEIVDKLKNLMLVIEGTMLVIGVILLFSGQVAWGLGIIIASLIAMNYTMQSFVWSEPGIAEAITTLWAVLIGAELVIGAILVFSGANIPLGIGIIVAALIQGYALYEVSWDSVSQNVKNIISELGVVTGVVLIAIGLVMICTGVGIKAGILLLLTGLGIEIAAVAINWEELTTNVKTVLDTIISFIGGALIAIGVILICTGGVGIMAGIALIIAGLALETAVMVNWEEVPDNIKNVITTIAELVSTALIVIGVILICTGVGIVAGIALVIAGLALEAGAMIVNWDETADNVSNVLDTIIDLVGKALIAIGVILICTGVGIVPGIALIIAGLALEVTEMVNWEEVPTKTKETIAALSEIIGLALLEIGVVLLFMGQIAIGLGLIILGIVSLVTAVAAAPQALREFIVNEIAFYMKVIGGALVVLGVILCLTGVGIGMGIALILAGAASFIGGIAIGSLDTNILSSKITDMFGNVNNSVTTGVNTAKTTITNGFAEASQNAGKSVEEISKNAEKTDKTFEPLNASAEGAVESVNNVESALDDLDGKEVTAKINIEQETSSKKSTNMGSVWTPQLNIPHLAQGSVIPPNKEFLAVLGDQKQGRNFEAPEGLLRQIVREEMSGLMANDNINITFNGDLAALVRILNPVISRERTRAGSSLIIGGNRV